jgi:hypothetical protein
VLPHIAAYGGLITRELMFFDQPMVDAAGGVALLGRAMPVLSQPLIDGVYDLGRDSLRV